ncbi:LAMI_0H00804g1_1 [Lachancea mirantina]|uniref:LAMI_0H00804g1_1 n=1 Tax=Lachancea mirantina TaxID=1230905 RepID=A0A1G4KDI8_9SACH|nr:LAMI_0H00804g1_1 [Lachancea mirantina]
MKSSHRPELSHTLSLNIPFENERQAEIAVNALSPDPILKPQDFHIIYTKNASDLSILFSAVDDRVLRVGVSSIIESVKTVIETIDELQ